ncbi:hypothetical protein ACI2L1_43065 [Streptomyces sp. NPDC019531]|uniref:hypothetical protein n=1 Tax=Streptomyces sp. NPDC019531 TaxID=3365062 RepID=UPI00384F1ED2
MSRGHHRILSAIGIGCYVLAAIVALYLPADDFGPSLLVPLWIAHGVLLAVLLVKLGAGESALSAALLVVGASVMAVYVADTAREDLTLERRGERVVATVVREWRSSTRHTYDYTLALHDGTKVPGPALRATSDRYDVGQTLTVIEDPEGEIGPVTPGQADATGDVLAAASFALVALGAVPWTAWRGAVAVRRREARGRRDEQEHMLREALRTASPDAHGYLEVHPGHYPDVPHPRADSIAWEMGLKPDTPGSWRFRR